MTSHLTTTAQVCSITAALGGAGGIAALSFFDLPELQSQPADRSLPMLRWLFSRGSHVFPQAASISAAGFVYLAYDALPPNVRTVTRLFQTTNGVKVNGYIAAAALAVSILPFTRFVMIPNNFALIDRNKALGGTSSEGDARSKGLTPSAGESNGAKDPSRPQEQTASKSSEKQNREVYDMLEKFSMQNAWRAALLAAGGIVGLVTALQI